ncbi:MAG TPA: hypothetical protein VMB50_14920 [Myxococcales bacterium]|nr:hypothetical protein [Myxococcales bacterium]
MSTGGGGTGDAGCAGTWQGTECIETIASGQAGPFDLVVDQSTVYWTNQVDGGSVARAPKVPANGGAPVELATGQINPWALALAPDDASLYWTTWNWTNDGKLSYGTVVRAALDGGVPDTIAAAEAAPLWIAVGSTHLYWLDLESNSILEAAQDGTSRSTFWSDPTFETQAQGLAVDATGVYWTAAVNSASVSQPFAGAIMKQGFDGGPPITISSNGEQPIDLAIDGRNVYWITEPPGGPAQDYVGSIYLAPLDGGVPVLVAQGQEMPVAIAADSTSVYWVDQGFAGNGTIMKAPLDGGAPIVLVGGLNNPWDLAVDSSSVYWTNSGDGTVMKATPK